MKSYEQLIEAFSSGQISRRQLIARATALGVAAYLPSGLLAGQARAGPTKARWPHEGWLEPRIND